MEHGASLDLVVCCRLLIIPWVKGNIYHHTKNGGEAQTRIISVAVAQICCSHLFPTVNESLLLWRNPFLLFYSFFDPLHLGVRNRRRDIRDLGYYIYFFWRFFFSCTNLVCGLNVDLDFFSSESLKNKTKTKQWHQLGHCFTEIQHFRLKKNFT